MTYWLAVGVVLLSSLLGGAMGFGSQLVLAPMLALIDPSFVPASVLGIGFVLVLLMAWRDRSAATWADVKSLYIGHLVGAVIAGLLLVAVSAVWLEAVFAGSVLVAVVLSIAGWRLRPSRRNAILVGGVAGVVTTLSSMGGPVVALYYQREQGQRFRALLARYFVVSVAISLVVMLVAGRFGWKNVRDVATLSPAVWLGFTLSSRFARRLEPRNMSGVALTIAACAAIVVLLRAAFSW